MVAVNQFVMWWRIMEILDENATAVFDNLRGLLATGTAAAPMGQEFAQNLNKTAMAVLDRFVPSESIRQTLDSVVGRVNDIAQLPDAVFAELAAGPGVSDADLNNLLLDEGAAAAGSPAAQLLLDKLGQLLAALTKAVLSSFKLKPFDKTSTETIGSLQADTAVAKSFDLVVSQHLATPEFSKCRKGPWLTEKFQFTYAFVASGSMLLLLTALHAVSKRQGWTLFNLLRSFLVTTVGLGLCLIPVTVKASLISSPIWALPVICGSLMIVLVITHVPHPRTGMVEDVRDLERGDAASYRTGQN